MATELVHITREFEGAPLTTLSYKGRPAWVAREIGKAIGYSHGGKRLPNKIKGDWAAEFIEGHDYAVLTGAELAAFKEAVGPGTDSVPGRTAALLILFESGLHLALVKTNKPVGRRLRRFIVDQVLPQLVRDGRFEAGRQLATIDPRVHREMRLARKLELEDRKFKVRTLHQTIEGIADQVSPEAVTSLRVAAAEIALERDLSSLKPAMGADWQAPSQIARRLGVSPNRVGRAITKLKLRGDIPGLCRAIMNKAQHSDRNVVSFLYSPEAVARIENQLAADGYVPQPDPPAAA